MSATVLCPRCGVDLPVVLDALDEATSSMVALISDHECKRILVAEHWMDGEIVSRWHSDEPQKTGPWTLVLRHSADASFGWQPPAGSHGWTYRWVARDRKEDA